MEQSRAVTVSRWWHGVIAAVILASLVIQLVLIFTGGADANSGETGLGLKALDAKLPATDRLRR